MPHAGGTLQPAFPAGPRRRVAALALALLTWGLVFSLVAPARAAIVTPFAVRYKADIPGDISLIGNSSMVCPLSDPACVNGRNGTGAKVNNNDYPMIYVDVDSDGSTFNSSTADLGLPAGAAVRFAGLYWSAYLTGNNTTPPPDASLRGQVQFQAPGGGYQTVAASVLSDTNVNGAYQGFADVTSTVSAAGNGTYGVGNIQAATGPDTYAGWGMVVVYRDPTLPVRDLVVYDGFGFLQNNPASDRTLTIPVSGFQTPPAGPVTTRIGDVTYEGDLGLTGDQYLLNGTNLTNAVNPVTNVMNSTNSDLGALVTSRNPNWRNLFGHDVDRFDASGILANNATNATITMTTGGERIFPGAITFATDLYAPDLKVSKTAVDPGGGALVPGDRIDYTIDVSNQGNDAADLSELIDDIPAGTTYVPGSMRLDATPLTDQPGDDAGTFLTGPPKRVRVELGSGSTPSTGGTIGLNGSTTVRFSVTVNAGVTDGTVISNVANVSYRGAQTGIPFTTDSNAAVLTVTIPPNAPPVARDDHAHTFRNIPVTIDVLANDSDPNGDPLTITGTAGGHPGAKIKIDRGGTPHKPGDDVIRYTPSSGFEGIDTFTYTISDGNGGTASATVTVNVVNRPPHFTGAAANTHQTVPLGGTVQPLQAVDPDGDPLTYRQTGGELPKGVTALRPDGSFAGSPSRPGTYRVRARVCDDGHPPLCDTTVLGIVVPGPFGTGGGGGGTVPLTGASTDGWFALMLMLFGAGFVLVRVNQLRLGYRGDHRPR